MRWLLLGTLLLIACSAPPPSPTPTPTPSPTTTASPSQSPAPSPTRKDELVRRVEQVRKVLKVPPGARRAAVLFQAVGSEQAISLGSPKPFESASLVKLAILAELYRRVEAGDLSLDEEMTFEERFRVGGSGSIQNEPAGKRYRLGELGRRMIAESDNVATDMLLERLRPEAVEIYARKIGMLDTTVRRTIFDFAAIDEGRDNYVTARDLQAFFLAVAGEKLPGSQAMREILENQTRNEMIPAALPGGTRVAHKSGELTGILHDAGIVSTPEGDYLLILLGEWDDREQGVSAWKKLSGEVYQAFTR